MQKSELAGSQIEAFLAFEDAGVKRFVPSSDLEGALQCSLDLELPRNAVVDSYAIDVQARAADLVRLDRVAQLRTYREGESSRVVVDFGTLRTVGGVQMPEGLDVSSVRAWVGTAFADTPVYSATIRVAGRTALFPAEVRTERLLIALSGDGDLDGAGAGMVFMPEVPAGLELTIDGGPPVWRHPGPVKADPDAQGPPRSGAWNRDGTTRVELGPELARRTGDPTRGESVTFRLALTSQVPGVLDLSLPADPPPLKRVDRISFPGGECALGFAEEGASEIQLPSETPPLELRVTLLGELTGPRAEPPEGPQVSPTAELVLDTDHWACVRLTPVGRPLPVCGLRLPLRAGAEGAELHAVLLADAGGEPGEPVEGGLGQPVRLDPARDQGWSWTVLAFPAPVGTAGGPLWAALRVSRGTAVWGLAGPPVSGDPGPGSESLRLGPAGGPWSRPPPAFAADPELRGLQGALRLLVPAEARASLPGVLLVWGPERREIEPTAQGIRLTLAAPLGPADSAHGSVLRVLSRAAGRVVLRDVDIVSTG